MPNTPDEPLAVDLITRAGCHLCDIALAVLRAAAAAVPIEVRLLDVDADPDLHALYDWRVPVVMAGGRPIAEGVITPLGLRAALQSAAQA